MARVIIGADLCPIGGNQAYFAAGDAQTLFQDLLPEFKAADLVVANLECALIKHPSPIRKVGPVFGVPSACISALQRAGVKVLNLANNHILDHGPAGLQNTLEVCARAGIATVGAGENLAAARRGLILPVKSVRVGLLAVAEKEFSIAAPNSWGANPLDLVALVHSIQAHRDSCDYLIVLLHGSYEFFVPTPRIQETSRFLIEMGADLVVVQHPHALGGYEQYRGGHLIYGQGALLLDEAEFRNLPSFHEGFLVKLTLEKGAAAQVELLPFVQSFPAPGARRMAPEAEGLFRQRLEQKANAVQDPESVRRQWLQFCQERKHDYMNGLLAHNRFSRALNRRGWLIPLTGQTLLDLRNCICCESHREVFETLFTHHLV